MIAFMFFKKKIMEIAEEVFSFSVKAMQLNKNKQNIFELPSQIKLIQFFIKNKQENKDCEEQYNQHLKSRNKLKI